jgi:2-C-methyl-D-erythritol 4-phosphate cytidylyltransferase
VATIVIMHGNQCEPGHEEASHDVLVWTILVAGGSGRRFGGAKQFSALADRRVIDWSLAAARAASDGVVLVAPADLVPALRAQMLSHDGRTGTVEYIVAGGATRSASVRAGLAAVPDDADIVLVHDAARPLASAALFAAVIAAVRSGAVAVVPAVPVTDSIRHVQHGVVDRDHLVAVQTPQGFAASALRQAHADEPDSSDDASVVEAIGGKVVLVPGEPTNLKITEAHDLVLAEALLRARLALPALLAVDPDPDPALDADAEPS